MSECYKAPQRFIHCHSNQTKKRTLTSRNQSFRKFPGKFKHTHFVLSLATHNKIKQQQCSAFMLFLLPQYISQNKSYVLYVWNKTLSLSIVHFHCLPTSVFRFRLLNNGQYVRSYQRWAWLLASVIIEQNKCPFMFILLNFTVRFPMYSHMIHALKT
jgi:hypothetical protein